MTMKTIPINHIPARNRFASDFIAPLAESRKDEIEAVVAIACDVIKTGSFQPQSEIRRLRAFVQSFVDDGNDAQAVVFADGMIDFYRDHAIEPRWIKKVLPNLASRLRIALFAFLDHLAMTSEPRRATLEGWRNALSIGDDVALAIRAARQDTLTEAYATLGVPPGSAPDAVKQAWRNCCKEFHPDLYSHLPQSFRDFARDRFQRAAEAYDRIVAGTANRQAA